MVVNILMSLMLGNYCFKSGYNGCDIARNKYNLQLNI